MGGWRAVGVQGRTMGAGRHGQLPTAQAAWGVSAVGLRFLGGPGMGWQVVVVGMWVLG